MLSAIAKAFRQLGDAATRKVLWRSLIATAVAFAVLVFAVEWLIAETRLFEWATLDLAAGILGGLGALLISILLFPAVAVAVMGFFLEDVAAAVEAKYYPELPEARVQPIGEQVMTGLRFAGVTAGLNLLALPLYAILTFVPPLNLLLFYGLNGLLLGREYFELVALRRMDSRAARAVRHVYAGRLLLAGVLITFLSVIPIANLLTPVVATAFMVHIVEGLRGEAAGLPGAAA
jgi:uncharacterized protein involved in cysteine biosynthesis